MYMQSPTKVHAIKSTIKMIRHCNYSRLHILLLAGCLAFLTACSIIEGDDGDDDDGDNKPVDVILIGNGIGANFEQDTVYIDSSNLMENEEETIQVSLVKQDHSAYINPTMIQFSTACESSVISTDSVETIDGVATATYTGGLCLDGDTITATTTVNGNVLTATVDIIVTPVVTMQPLDIDDTNLFSGESTNLSVSLVYSDLSHYPINTAVTFSTSCPSSIVMPGVTSTTGGIAIGVYIAGTCEGMDTITAEATVGTTVLTRTVNVGISRLPLNLMFGKGAGATFVEGLLEAGTGDPDSGQPGLSPGGTTSITATLVDADNSNVLYTAIEFDVHFSSPCISNGTAVSLSPVSSANGVFVTNYVNNGCVGNDVVTASIVIEGNVHYATVTINNLAAAVGSIQFISASPPQIALRDIESGVSNTSLVTFLVMDVDGTPIEGQTVSFSSSTNIGGVSVSTLSAITAADGTVSTTLQAGTIAVPVKVTAETTDIFSGLTYTTQSDFIQMSSAIADESNFSLSVSDCNPVGAYENDGVTVDVTVNIADHFNYTVPDGTSVGFRTEGGAIEPFCTTFGGSCTVNWTSQNPRPMEAGQEGRTTIMAYVLGNESFLDANSNGAYDDSDPDFSGIFTDLAEAWVDVNENGIFDNGSEEYLDFNGDGVFTPADGLYTGVLCQRSSDCAELSSFYISKSAVIHMASANNTITIDGGNGENADFELPLTTDAPRQVDFIVKSATGHYPASGTTIQLIANNGSIIGATDYAVPGNCTRPMGEGYHFSVHMQGDGTGSTSTLTVTATSGGVVSQQTVNITDQSE